MSMNRYRIVRDCYLGYEVQVKRWWWPFWMQIGGRVATVTNTNRSIEDAEALARDHASGRHGRFVKELGVLAEPRP